MIRFIVKTIKYFFTIIFFVLFSLGVKFLLIYLGLLSFIAPISGNSMMPTLVDQQRLPIYAYNKIVSRLYSLKRGDMVVFSNNKTEGSEYIKRIIGIPGDKISLSNGYVSVNGQKISEKYILKPRSSFGGQFLPECREITVPNNQVFVMGDNRKRSLDSREIGYVNISDIDQYLPLSRQNNLSSRWRDPSQDFVTSAQPIFDTSNYYQLLNEFRQKNNRKTLKTDSRLEALALLRAKKLVLEYDSPQDKKTASSEYQKDISRSGYSNIITEELTTFGFYEADELMDYWREKKNDNMLLNSEFTETGIVSLVTKVNGCEVQIVVQEFGGYKPPSYTAQDKQNITNIINDQKEAFENLKKINTDSSFYSQNKNEIEKLSSIMSHRLTQYQSISDSMSANKWLSTTQNEFLTQDKELFAQQQRLVQELNDKIKRENSH